MIIVAAKLKAKSGMRESVQKVLAPCVVDTRKESGCISYTPYLAVENDVEVFLFEQWTSQAHLDAHMQTPHFKAMVAGTKEFLQGDLEVEVFETKN